MLGLIYAIMSSSLVSLDISATGLDYEGSLTVAHFVRISRNLKALDISDNDFQAAGIELGRALIVN